MPRPVSLTTEEGLALVGLYGAAESWLAVLVTLRPDGQPSTSVVNAGIIRHPITSEAAVAFVARGSTAKLTNLRAGSGATLVFRSGWEWIAVRGQADLAGPDDLLPGLGDESLRQLLRDIYTAAGGTHDNLNTYDAVMATERRTAVLLHPEHFATNPAGTEHQEHG